MEELEKQTKILKEQIKNDVKYYYYFYQIKIEN